MSVSPLRQIVRLGVVAAVVLAAFGWRAAVVEAGPGAPLRVGWHVAADTDTVAITLPDSIENAFPDDPFATDPLQSIVDSLVDARAGAVDSTLAADSTAAADSTERARRYLPGTAYYDPFGQNTIAPPIARRTPALRGKFGTYWNRDVTLDTSVYRYTIRQQAGGQDVREPTELDLREFLVTRRAADLRDGYRTLAANRSNRANRRGGVGVTFDIPGGETSAFSTIFGKNEVDLRVNGTSNVNLGLSYDESAAREALQGDAGVFSPDFGQELNLTVRGTIGDKLAINVNYDTQSQFEFENQVSLVYTGYEDDIVQRVEAGNVFLQTPAELIRGGQRLFGIRTDFQLGPLALKAVASQQDAETREVVIDGGAQATAFDLAPYDYEEDTNFFFGYAFHNWWNEGHRDAGIRIAPPGYAELIGIEVWKYDPSVTNNTTNDDETTYAVALADLGEPGGLGPDGTPQGVLRGGEAYFEEVGAVAPLPSPLADQYTDADLANIRENYASINFETEFGLQGGSSYATNQFKKLRANVDYTLDSQLGYLSLATRLNETDVVAVAYQYRTTDGEIVTVGDYANATQSNTQSGTRSLLKLIRVNGQTPADPLWDLSMRNIYRIGGRSLNASSFQLAITYEAPGQTARDELPGITLGEQLTALQVFGLDRTNEQNQNTPDNLFDFLPGVTVDPAGGRIIFPVRQPYGDYLRQVIQTGTLVDGTTVSRSFDGTTEEALLSALVPTASGEDLYDLRSIQAERQLQGLSRFSLSGEFKSATQSIFNVGFNLVEGTVRVTSGERELVEGTDFRVNTSQGTVEITNPLYLQSGQQVRIQVEQNQFFSIGSKTLVGLRADYRLSEDATLGGTWMRLSERPLVDKFRVGEEALQNTIMGLDGAYRAEPRWLTRAVDALPLIQTRAPSRFEIRGEVARLSPDHPETFAFEQTRRQLQDSGFDLEADEIAGVSYVDDFEGSENAFTALGESGGWRTAAAPDSSGPANAISPTEAETILDARLATNWRGAFGWYTIPNIETYRDFRNDGLLTRATSRVLPGDLYNRVGLTPSAAAQPLGLLDLYFDPTRRGIYNFNGELETTFAQNPRTVWGGMVRGIDASYSDFEGQNNIEYMELLMQPLGGRNGDDAIEAGAVLYIDLGRINEDVLPNGSLNQEDGLRDGGTPGAELDRWGRRPSVQTNGAVDFFEATGRTEDLGLDGLPTRVSESTGEPYQLDEVTFFSGRTELPTGGQSADFIGALTPGTLEYERATRDPSLDDYHHFDDDNFFNDAALFPGGASVQERFSQYFPSFELNSITAQSRIGGSGGEAGISTRPNSEDINENSTVDALDAFHRYALPLDEAGLRASPFFQNDISFTNQDTGTEDTFYLLRIPVRTDNRTTSRGLDRDDFSRIEAVRVWTTGHDKPATLRVASFELVGSQWLQSEQIGAPPRIGDPTGSDPDLGTPAELFIESVNSEESPLTYAPPRTTIRPVSRDFTGGQGAPIREQSIVLRAEGLAEGYAGAITRTYSTRPLDLTKYSNLRMFTHGHGFERRDSMRVFIRLGDDESENYYEYSQPLYPFDPDRAPDVDPASRADSLWQMNVPVGGGETLDLNSVNIVLSALNRLKVSRDNSAVPVDQLFTSTTTPEGAPPGARIAVRGQPSVQDVKVIALGLRNGLGGQAVPIDTATVWFNELRVSGYDEKPGSAGFLTASLALADLASLNARFSFTDDGFGDLGSGLGEREFADRTAFSIQSTFNAHKLLPERFGWSVPVSVSVTQNASTPRFDPDRGDILLDDLAEQARTDSTIAEPERIIRADEILERAQSVSSSRTVRVPISKSGSRSPWLKYSLDALAFAYSNTAQRARTPSNAFNDLDSWRSDLSYRLTVPRPKTVVPFWLLRPIPLLGVLGDLKLNLLPRQLSLSGDLGRSVSANQPRLRDIGLSTEPDSLREFQVRTRRTQSFTHGRQMDVQYDPFSFLNLTYGSNVAQDLGAAGQDESFRIFARTVSNDPDDPAIGQIFEGISPDSARAAGSSVRQALGLGDSDPIEILGGSDLDVLGAGDAIQRVFRGGFVQTRDYQQTANAALRVSTQKVKWLSWIRPQAISFGTAYRWTDTPLTSRPLIDIASVQTRAQMQAGVQFQPRTFWRLFPFYRSLEGSRNQGGRAGRGTAQRGRPARGGETPAAPEAASADTTSSGRGLVGRLARGTFLALTGIDDISLTYRGSLNASSNGVSTDGFSLLSAFANDAPSLGYRLGLDRSLPRDFRLADPETGLRLEDRLGDDHALQARTQLEPFRGLRIGLNWQTSWNDNETFNFEYLLDGGIARLPSDLRGGGESSVLSVGASYDTYLQRQVDRLADDLNAGAGDDGAITSDFRSRNGLAKDFLEEFGRGPGRYGAEALLSLPSPGWDITYSGLGNWPFLKKLTNQVTLRHGYLATSASSYGSIPRTTPLEVDATLPDRTVTLQAPAVDVEASQMTVNERFQPLIGVAVGWKAGFQTDLTWNRSNLYTLQTNTAQFSEKTVEDVQIQFSFTRNGIKIPLFKRLNNNIRLTLTAGISDDETLKRSISSDLSADLLGQERIEPGVSSVRRVSVWPRLSYSLSNRVTADVFLRYEQSRPVGTQAFPTSSFDGGVSFRISFSN